MEGDFAEDGAKGFAPVESAVFAALSKGFSRPTVGLALSLTDGSFAAQLESLFAAGQNETVDRALRLLREYCLACAPKGAEQVRLELEVDFNRLFVGPGKVLAPPYESYYRSGGAQGGRLRTQDEKDVKEAYRRFGLALPEDCVELSDHIAVELEFLALLHGQCVEAARQGDDAEAARLAKAAARFEEDHLGTWVHDFADDVRSFAQTPFYASLALLVSEMF